MALISLRGALRHDDMPRSILRQINHRQCRMKNMRESEKEPEVLHGSKWMDWRKASVLERHSSYGG